MLKNDIEEVKDIEKVKKEEYQFKKEDANDIDQYTTQHTSYGTEFSEEMEFETSFDKDNEIDSNLPDDVQVMMTEKPLVPTTSAASKTTTTPQPVEIIILEGEEYLTLPNSTDPILQKPSFRSNFGNISDNELVKRIKESLMKNASENVGSDVPKLNEGEQKTNESSDKLATVTEMKHIDTNVLANLKLFESDGLQPTDDGDDDFDPQHFR